MKSNKLFVKNNSIDIRVSFCVLLDHVFPLFRLAGKFDTQTHKHTNTQTHKHTNTQTHKHTNTQTHFQTFHSHLVIPDQVRMKSSFLLTTPE
jgi:hypothetical protein